MKDYLKDVNSGNLVREVACGAFHSMAITENGVVYGWGANDCQQLGFKGKKEVWAPVRVPIPLPVSQITCGFAHTVALLQNGRLVTFGLNHKY
jgi:alpha-tubulin suppressor-like RCC1 family protein